MTESEEQQVFVQWLEHKGMRFSALPLSTWTRSWSQKIKNKKEGVRSGVPDILLLVPCYDGKKRAVFIEFKKKKGGRVSEHQKEWIDALNECEEVGAYVANGYEEAKNIIHHLQKNPSLEEIDK